MLLTKEQILAQRLRSERVPVPWIEGAEVIVRGLPSHVVERSRKEDLEDPDAYVFVNALVNEKGERLYTDDDAKAVAETVDTALIQFVVSKAFDLCLVPEDRREAIKKNLQSLGGEPSGESPSPSDTHTPT